MGFDNRHHTTSAETDPLNIAVKRTLDNNGFAATEADYDPQRPETWPLEMIKAAALHAERNNPDNIASQQAREDGNAFAASHPAYKDTVANARLIVSYWHSRGVAHPNYEQQCEAYEFFKREGCLDLKQDVLRQEQLAADRARAEAIEKRNVFDEDAAYNKMSMDELRARASAAEAAHRRAR